MPPTPHTTPPIRVLVIGQDNLFAQLPHVQSHHVITRHTYTPDADIPPHTIKPLWTSLLNLLRGHYHLAIFPAVDLNWIDNVHPFQKYARNTLRLLTRIPLSKPLFKLIRPRHTHIAVLDRYDIPTIHHPVANLFNTNSYWKVNLSNPPPPQPKTYQLHHIPMWIFPPKNGWHPIPWKQKNIDVFAAFSLNAPQRNRALQWLHNFAAKHPEYNIIIPDKPLPKDDFQDHLQRSRICLSPDGIGFHCFRHYQTMACGTVPFITRNPTIQSDIVHLDNCILYDDNECGFYNALLNALQNPTQLYTISQNAQQLFHQRHTPEAVAQLILKNTLPQHSTTHPHTPPAHPLNP